MARIGNITFDLPGESGQTMAQSLAELLAQIRQELEKTVSQAAKSFDRMGADAKTGIGTVAQILNGFAKGTLKKTSGSFKRSLMGFDELNRLTKSSGTSTAVKQNYALAKSVEELFSKIGQMGSVVDEQVMTPVAKWGTETFVGIVDRMQQVFSGAVQLGKEELQGYTGVWDQLNLKTDFWKALLEQTNGITGVFSQTLQQGGQSAAQMSGQIQGLGQDTANTAGQMQGLGTASQNTWQAVVSAWEGSDHWFHRCVTEPLQQTFSSLWTDVQTQAGTSWDGTKSVFSDAGGFFERTFSDAWGKVSSVFSKDGEVFTDIQDGVLSGFKFTVNDLIDGINQVTAVPFGGLNDVLSKLQSIKIGSLQPFSFLSWRATVPKIPHLAQGAVLPANKPFLAMVGDQRHGTNVEAPLATIQEAVALVMQDYTDANMAGHSATVEVLREILQAVLGISIGDEVIAGACERYRSKMSVIYGR